MISLRFHRPVATVTVFGTSDAMVGKTSLTAIVLTYC